MAIETIKDQKKRLFWQTLINETHEKLKKKGNTDILFTTFKDDGSYGKAKTGLKSVNWVFAQDSNRKWVELELKSVVKDGERIAQKLLYGEIKSGYAKSDKKTNNLTWDEDDPQYRHAEGKAIRIKIYLQGNMSSNINPLWSDTMVEFINVFKPILDNIRNR